MNYIVTTTDGEYLQHHGIMGQRWGIRRYQNPDGTLTEEGARRLHRNLAEDGSYHASNGIKLGTKAYNDENYRKLHRSDGTLDRDYDRRLANAMDEYRNAWKDDLRGTGTKHLDKAIRRTKISDTKRDIFKSQSIFDHMIYDDKVWEEAAKSVVDSNMTMEQAVKKAKTKYAVTASAALAIVGAYEISKFMK